MFMQHVCLWRTRQSICNSCDTPNLQLREIMSSHKERLNNLDAKYFFTKVSYELLKLCTSSKIVSRNQNSKTSRKFKKVDKNSKSCFHFYKFPTMKFSISQTNLIETLSSYQTKLKWCRSCILSKVKMSFMNFYSILKVIGHIYYLISRLTATSHRKDSISLIKSAPKILKNCHVVAKDISSNFHEAPIQEFPAPSSVEDRKTDKVESMYNSKLLCINFPELNIDVVTFIWLGKWQPNHAHNMSLASLSNLFQVSWRPQS